MNLEQCLELAGATSEVTPIAPPTPAEIEALLDFTRAVAHAGERRAAPLAAYAVGIAWAGRDAGDRVRLLRMSTAAIDAANFEVVQRPEA